MLSKDAVKHKSLRQVVVSCLQRNERLMGLKPTEQKRSAKNKVFQPEARRNTMLLSSYVEGKMIEEELYFRKNMFKPLLAFEAVIY